MTLKDDGGIPFWIRQDTIIMPLGIHAGKKDQDRELWVTNILLVKYY